MKQLKFAQFKQTNLRYLYSILLLKDSNTFKLNLILHSIRIDENWSNIGKYEHFR